MDSSYMRTHIYVGLALIGLSWLVSPWFPCVSIVAASMGISLFVGHKFWPAAATILGLILYIDKIPHIYTVSSPISIFWIAAIGITALMSSYIAHKALRA